MADKILENVYWLGSDNPSGRSFHGIDSPRGGSYNSYLILDEHPTIIDGANKPFLQAYLDSLKSLINPADISYLVVNHAENDHAGALKEILAACPKAKVVCTEKCRDFLHAAFGVDREFVVVKDGDELSLAMRKLRFYTDPMVHWPETMMTYDDKEKILFTGDLFATEIAHTKVFADEMEDYAVMTRDYFAMIMRPYVHAAFKAVGQVKKISAEQGINYLVPSHGPVYRKTGVRNVDTIIRDYDKWLGAPEDDKVFIAYYSIWHSTQRMAELIAEGVRLAGYEAVICDISKTNMVAMMAEAMTSRAVAFGSLTMIGQYHPMFDALLKFLHLNHQREKPALVFGTYGWATEAVPLLKKRLEEDGYKVMGEADMRFGPRTKEDEESLRELGRKLVKPNQS